MYRLYLIRSSRCTLFCSSAIIADSYISVCFGNNMKVTNNLRPVICRSMTPQRNCRASYAAVVISMGCILLVTDFISYADAYTPRSCQSETAPEAKHVGPTYKYCETELPQARADAMNAHVQVLFDLLTLKRCPIFGSLWRHHKIFNA